MNVNRLLHASHNWPDFKNQLKGLSTKQKGDCFEVLTKYYLQLSPKYIAQLRKVWLLREVPEKVRKHLNLPGPDEGIDLVAETKDGEFWAIQCKYLEAESASLNRKQLSTFLDLAFNICRHISFCLVCSPADQFSSKFTKYGGKLGFCLGDEWRGLDKEFFARLRRTLEHKAAPLKARKPRRHQQQAIQHAYQYFVRDKQSRGKLIMPCGTGKSLVGYWIAEKLNAKTILIAVPSLSLIRQTLEVWTKEMVAQKQDVHWMAVCSDESVGDIERDDVVVLTQDLGIRVHTHPNEIAQWLKARRKGRTVVFTTYQSGQAIAQAARKSRTVFDVGIMDEAHKTVGQQESLFCHLLHDNNITIKKRIFMTATERRYRGQSDEISSMGDPTLYGETFHLLSFKKALEASPPILSDYKIITIFVTRQEVADLIKRNVFLKPNKGGWNKEIEAEMLAGVIALRKAIQKWPIRHAVSFHSRIARAGVFKENQDIFGAAFPEYRQIETFHVFGTLPTSVRSRTMEAFSTAKRSLVTNARCLTEGVDVPNIDCVLFADSKKSTIDIVQAVGRALRTFPGKRFGYVVVPVLIDGEVKEDQTLDRNAFNPILIVLRSLAANDERIIEYFKAVSQGRRPVDGRDRINIDIPVGLKIDTARFVNSVHLKLWPRLAKLSWRPFDEARAYIQSLGLKNVADWKRYIKGELPEKGVIPEDIPTTPEGVYKERGWLSFGDWLGTGVIATNLREYRTFHKARSFVHNLELKNQVEWGKYCRGELPEKGKLPNNVPAHPQEIYKEKGWVSLGDWLGTNVIANRSRTYRSFRQARKFVHQLSLTGNNEWRKYCIGRLPEKGKLPKDIPTHPHIVYKNQGWIGWGDWYGTGTVATRKRTYRSFKDARSFVHRLKLGNWTEWRKYRNGELPKKDRIPNDIPANPQRTYKNQGWVSFGDWLGTGIVATRKRKYRSFHEARAFVHRLKLKSWSEWRMYCQGELPEKGQLPEDIPANPNRTYEGKGWRNSGDWLGTGTIAPRLRQYRSFKKARRFVQSLSLKSTAEWQKFCRGEQLEKGPVAR